MSHSTSVLFITANPSISYTLQCNTPVEGRVNRCDQASIEWADGKANIAARAFTRLGGTAIALFPADDYLGKRIEELLRAEGVSTHRLPIPIGTRRTFVIRNAYSTPPVEREYLDPGPNLPRDLLDRFIRLAETHLTEDLPVIISGSLPPGWPSDFYCELVHAIRNAQPSTVILLDTSGPPLLAALESPIDYLKVNCDEFMTLSNAKLSSSSMSLMHSIRKLSLDADISIIVTRGPKSVQACLRKQGCFEVEVPSVAVSNTVGAGDSFTAGFARAMDLSPEDQLAYAVASATASVMTLVPGRIEAETVDSMSKRVTVRRVS